jgi:hypothetical protein
VSRSPNVDELLADEDRLWLELTEIFGDVSPERFDEPSVTPEGWSPKDVMYHVASWADEAATVLGRIAAGTHTGGDPDTQALNEEWFEMGRGLDDDVVRIRFAKGRTAMRQAFTRLPEVDTAAWEWFEESGPRHYQEHLPDLRAFLERDTPRP